MKNNIQSARVMGTIRKREAELLKKVAQRIKESKSDNTWRAYEASWDAFDRFCESMKLQALPADPLTVAMFMEEQFDAGMALSTLQQRLAAIRAIHLESEHSSPTNSQIVKDQMSGIKRRKKSDVPQSKVAATSQIIKAMLGKIDTETLLGKRDRALLLYGFAAALRRSEIVGIDVEHIEDVDRGQLLLLPYSKTDQDGKGMKVAILARPDSDLCPVTAISDWLRASGIKKGPVFRRFFRGDKMGESRLSDKAVERLVKDLAYALHLDFRKFSGHSLRSGFITSAVASSARLDKVKEHARHTKYDTTLTYVKDGDRFTDHAGQNIDDLGSILKNKGRGE